MALQTQTLKRVFRYNSVNLPDPGPQYTIEQARDLYANTYPEIVNAAIEGPEEKNGQLEYTFRRAVGTKGIAIAAERRRQILVEGWYDAHDDQHRNEELARAAACYALPMNSRDCFYDTTPPLPLWPWGLQWWKPGPMTVDGRIRDLEKAGALIAAEIDRLLRLQKEHAST